MSHELSAYFRFDHLPQGPLRETSKLFADLAARLTELPIGAEREAGYRKLLEAKDCFVRAALDVPKAPGAARGG